MATRHMTVTTDDLDGSTIDNRPPVAFSVDGRAYEIDLSDENAERLREVLAPYVEAARLVKWPRTSKRRPAA